MSTCKICNSPKAKKLVDWKEYEIYRCQSCQLLFSTPDPTTEQLDQFYQGFLHRKPNKKDIPELIQKKINELQGIFKIQKEGNASRKFLDYGGGIGIAYHAAGQMGLDNFYHDIDQDSIKFVRENFSLPNDKFIANTNESSDTFDYIFVDNVIEHVIDPESLITDLYHKLNDQGVLLFKTPNANNSSCFFYPRASIEGYFKNALKYNSFGSALSMFLTKGWHCDPPRHLYSFTKKSFDIAMKKMGIAEDHYEIAYYQHPLFEFSLTKSFLFIDREYKGIQSILIRILLIPIILLELMSKALQFVLYKLKLISPVGLILSIKKQ